MRVKEQVRQGERGVAAVWTALCLVVLVGFSAFAVDLGYLYNKRRQLQTAADVAALAGAQALVTNGWDAAAAKEDAVTYGRLNIQARDNPELALGLDDVAVNGNSVRVDVGVTGARENPAQLFLARALGVVESDVAATATAQIVQVSGSRCMLPVAIPNGAYQVGQEFVIKMGDPHQALDPSQYFLIDYPPSNKGNPVPGGNNVRANLSQRCSPYNNGLVEIGDTLETEPGKKSGPTKQGIQDRIDADPGAYWDGETIVNSAYPDPFDPVDGSPRVGIMPFYDPANAPGSGRTSTTIAGLGAVFIRSVDKDSTITAVFIRAMAEIDLQDSVGQNNGSNLYYARLIQ